VDREYLLALLAILFGGSLTFGAGASPARIFPGDDARTREALQWAHLVRPLAPAGAALAALAGWAVLEPDDAEAAPWPLLLAALPFGVLWLRALMRAALAVFARADAPAFTSGLLRPRVVLSERLAEALDPDATRAALAHEEMHVRHHDPLQIWIAQIATDLQAPWPSARARLHAWKEALELARDEEARRRGVDGADLAAAILAAARLGIPDVGRGAVAGLCDQSALERRIQRLLAPLPPEPRALRKGSLRLATVIVLSVAFGASFGEKVVHALLGAGV
jgi:hypothetical protein